MPGEPQKVGVGDTIDGRYRILSTIGSGGMGQVYKAEHLGIKRVVALKLLHPQLRDNEDNSERIRREAFATGRLDHPNCVAITDSGTLPDGATFLVMELLNGQSLGDELEERGTLPVLETLHIARDVLQGLAHAHSVGVVHRDLKPDNIFLARQNGQIVAKILDFGIAKLLGDAMEESGGADLTQAGMAVGSPTYMSPEQATGETLDGRTDLYSLSLVLYEMLTGEPPFYEVDDKMLSLQRRLKEDPPPMRTPSGAAIPTPVEMMIRAGLGRNVEDRTSSAAEYLQRVNEEIEFLEAEERAPTNEPDVPLSRAITDKDATNGEMTGLAPVEPVAPPSAKQRLMFFAIGAAIIVVAVFFSTRGSSSNTSTDDSSDEMVFDDDEVARQPGEDTVALAARLERDLARFEKSLEAGSGAKHLRAMKRLQASWSDSPRTNRALGLAYMEKRYWQDGFKYLRKALQIDSSLRKDPLIIKAAIRSLTSSSKPGLGLRFLVRDIGEVAIPLLRETMESGSDQQREYAAKAIRELEES
jgi:serine/threonine protein kinase